MKRDLDLVRKILFACEADEPDGTPLSEHVLEIEGHSAEQVAYHCLLLGDAGLAKVQIIEDYAPCKSYVSRLTWAGHEFLDAARDDERWNFVRSTLEAAKALTFESVRSALSKVVADTVLGLFR